jgi:Fe2+ transport system protein FeoA
LSAVAGTHAAVRRLGDLNPGAHAVIRRIHGEPAMIRRLMELGLVPGTRVRFVRRAPMGDPIELVVRGTHFSLRLTEAHRIHVEAD